MIVTIENGTLTVIDYDVDVSETIDGQTMTLHLEVNVPLSFFRTYYPDMPPLDQGFEQLSYEPGNGILHVCRAGQVTSCKRPEQDYLLSWIDTNAANIHASGIEWRRNELRGIPNV